MEYSVDVDYLIHRLYEYFDFVVYYTTDTGWLLRVSSYTKDNGRIAFDHELPADFSLLKVDREVEKILIRDAEENYEKNK